MNNDEFLHIPWEFIYDDKYLHRFLCTENTTLFTRYQGNLDLLKSELNESYRGTNEKIKLKGLFVCANALGDQYINPEAEYGNISEQLKNYNDIIECCRAKSSRWEIINDELYPGTFNFVHFYGHGIIEDGEPKLIFTADSGGGDPVGALRFAQLFDGQKGKSMCFLLMNACNSAKNSISEPKSGLPQSLILSSLNRISAIIGMQFPLTVKAAGTFSQRIYQYITSEANPIDVAIQRARENLSGSYDYRATRLFATPVVFLRGKDGYIFDRLIPIQKAPDPEDAGNMLRSVQKERISFLSNVDTKDEREAIGEFWRNHLLPCISFFSDLPHLDDQRKAALDKFANEIYLKMLELKNPRNEEDRKKNQRDILDHFLAAMNYMSSVLNVPSKQDRYGKSISMLKTGHSDLRAEDLRNDTAIIEFYNIMDQIVVFKDAVKQCLASRYDERKLTNLARMYQSQINSFRNEVDLLVIELQKISYLSEKTSNARENLIRYISDLNSCFSNIVAGIDSLSNIVDKLANEFEKLETIITETIRQRTGGLVH